MSSELESPALSIDPAETPFKIHIPDSSIALLKQKLALTRLPDELEDSKRDYGVPLADLTRLLNRWKDGYDWRRFEKEINERLPQFTRKIEVEGHGELDIHYVHKRSGRVAAVPMLFVHGWPGSVVEVSKIIDLLTDPKDPDHPAFHLVTFSLPGYGFSSAPKKRGFAMAQYAEVGNKLMIALGYDKYVLQGGDWGGHITKRIANNYGTTHAMAWHTNYPRSARHPSPPSFFTLFTSPLTYLSYILTPYIAADRASFARSEWFVTEGQGYGKIQGTQPQTLSYSLSDSPAGLLAWIYEKLVNWTDDYAWGSAGYECAEDEVLDWVSLYWFSAAGPGASTRIYYEMDHGPDEFGDVVRVKTGYSYFPKEIFSYPRSWTWTPYVVFESAHESGGHFAAHERPDELVGDLRKMFGRGGPAFEVVPGKSGY